jgi:hypothetical protein
MCISSSYNFMPTQSHCTSQTAVFEIYYFEGNTTVQALTTNVPKEGRVLHARSTGVWKLDEA